MGRRAFVVVIDACGIGALPDAPDYGDDPAANTLAHVAELEGGLDLPVLRSLGLGSILPLCGVDPAPHPVLHGRLSADGPGKDSTAGHWELMGVVATSRPPSYADGLPADLLVVVERAIGAPVICNRCCNGVAAIEDYGAEHLASGGAILYTSVDSVLQLACHRQVMALDDLYAACERVRAVVGVGRVIARPFTGELGCFERTAQRRDFALPPPSRSYLEALKEARVPVHAVGKVAVITADHGCDPSAAHSDHTRESVPLLASFAGHGGRRHDGALADVGAAAHGWLAGVPARGLPGRSFLA